MSVTTAGQLANSRTWWQQIEKGQPTHRPDEAHLAAAALAVGADLDAVFDAAGYDSEPYRPKGHGEMDELSEVRGEVRRLAQVVARLIEWAVPLGAGIHLDDDGPDESPAT